MLALFLVSLCCVCSVSYACAPIDPDAQPCTAEMTLSPEQIQTVDRQRLRDLENDPAAFMAARHDEKIVELTQEQTDTAVRMNPDFFMSLKDLPPLPSTGERQDLKRQIPGQNNGGIPGQNPGGNPGGIAGPFSTRKCPPLQSYAPLSLAINGFGNVVQIIQPQGGNPQWIMDESCSSPFYGPGDNCFLAERLVSAYIIDFATYDFTVEMIKVYCCATYS
ncbi:uncharacterized protein [Amphiura filiformis]|uniref:uncharacterized protein n=1 Tax=Amphiura filiformis TaxID=82378 RepID=UPI003B21D40A